VKIVPPISPRFTRDSGPKQEAPNRSPPASNSPKMSQRKLTWSSLFSHFGHQFSRKMDPDRSPPASNSLKMTQRLRAQVPVLGAAPYGSPPMRRLPAQAPMRRLPAQARRRATPMRDGGRRSGTSVCGCISRFKFGMFISIRRKFGVGNSHLSGNILNYLYSGSHLKEYKLPVFRFTSEGI
jgi:hypothetical protein